MVESGFEQEHDPLAGGEIEIKEAAKPAHNRGATGHHPEAARKAPAGLPVRVSSSGQTIASFRKAFKATAKEAGMAGVVPYDMRRSAVRNFRRAGLSENEGMKLSGHETDSIYRRYDIISDDDLTGSMNRVQEHLKNEAENRKVVPLKRETA
jgi:integrase